MREKIHGIVLLGIFYFIFLGAEYLFDNMMANHTDSDGVVMAQSYILGISVIGFLIYHCLDCLGDKLKRIISCLGLVIGIVSIIIRAVHISYVCTLLCGLVLFVILGCLGSKVHYHVAVYCRRGTEKQNGKCGLPIIVGFAYALGIFLQFINNNVITDGKLQAVFISIALIAIIVLDDRKINSRFNFTADEADDNDEVQLKSRLSTGILLILIVAFMTFIFATLDNAVTLVHASGSVDIGQWPRLLLACSGIIAGLLYNIRDGAYQNIIMYCVMMLSTACILILSCGGPFLAGLLAFYMSAGFFSVYFATAFMRLSYTMRRPKLWAGLGRAVNNLCAVIMTSASLYLLKAPGYIMIIIALILFVITSLLIFVYQKRIDEDKIKSSLNKYENDDKTDARSPEELIGLFSEEFGLTQREREVLVCILHSDDKVADMAGELAMSRAALYRHISSMNEKTGTRQRMGLVQFYYNWTRKLN